MYSNTPTLSISILTSLCNEVVPSKARAHAVTYSKHGLSLARKRVMPHSNESGATCVQNCIVRVAVDVDILLANLRACHADTYGAMLAGS